LIDDRQERVEEWLRKLEKSREKIFDRNLYKAILIYTEKSYNYDYSDLTKSEFF